MLFSLTLGTAKSEDTQFLKQEKSIPAGKEWHREIVSANGGTVKIKIKGASPYSITLVTDAAYKTVNAGGQPKREDMLFTIDSKQETFEKVATLKKGNYWVIIENKSRSESTFLLECYEKK